MTRDQIIQAVRAKMDEIRPLNEGVTIVDPQIDEQLDGAAVSLVEMLPSVLANPVSATPTVTNIKDLSVDIECPADFVRIHRLTLDGWIRPVIELYPDGMKLLYQQDYKYLKATVRRPVAAMHHKDGTDFITCYPPAETVEEFVYVQRPGSAESLDDNLVEMLAWKAAGIIYLIHGQGDNAQACLQRLGGLIESKLKYRS